MTADRMELLYMKIKAGTLGFQAFANELGIALNEAWKSGADFGASEVIDP